MISSAMAAAAQLRPTGDAVDEAGGHARRRKALHHEQARHGALRSSNQARELVGQAAEALRRQQQRGSSPVSGRHNNTSRGLKDLHAPATTSCGAYNIHKLSPAHVV